MDMVSVMRARERQCHTRVRDGAVVTFLVFVLMLVLPGQISAQNAVFLPEAEVGDGSGMAEQCVLTLDVANAHITCVIDGKIYHRVHNTQVSTGAFITPEETAAQGDPSAASKSFGQQIFVIYSQEDTSGGVGREVMRSLLSGGSFLDQENLSDNENDESSPDVVVDANSERHVVWTRNNGGTNEIVYFTSLVGGQESIVGEGNLGQVAADRFGVAHVVYSRGRDLYYKNNISGQFASATEIPVTMTPQVDEFNFDLGVSNSGKIFLTYESLGRLLLVTSGDGLSFDSIREIDTGGVNGSSLHLSGDGEATIAYSLGGDIVLAFDHPLGTPDSVVVTSSPEVEFAPDVQINALTGDIHLVYLRDGNVYYTTNPVPPVAEFTANPVSGFAPLGVQFTDLSQNQIHTRIWDFGDGSPPSNESDPAHIFREAGEYTVTLTVLGPGGSAEATETVSVVRKVDFLTIPATVVHRGQRGAWLPVLAVFQEEANAFQLAGSFDPDVLEITDINFDDFTHPGVSEAQIPVWFVDMEPVPSFTVSVFMGDPETNIGTVLPPVDQGRLINFRVDIRNDIAAPQEGEFIRLEDGVSPPPSNLNLYTFLDRSVIPPKSRSVRPQLVNNPMRIEAEIDYLSLFRFVRGNADTEGVADFNDAIHILRYLFLGDRELLCGDLGDVDDNGTVDFNDSIELLKFLFLGGNAPRLPFPLPGPDPTPDDNEDEGCVNG